MNDGMLLIFDTIIALFGVYMIYVTINMKKTGVVNKLLLAPDEIKKLKDQKGFIESTYMKLLIFAIVVTIDGAIGIFSDLVYEIPYWSVIEMFTFLITVIIFTHFMRKAREKFLF